MDLSRAVYSRDLKIAAMRALDASSATGEIARKYRADGSLRSLMAHLARIDVLLIDDWAMAPFNEAERRDFWEICEDRYRRGR